jgi:alkylhydroperoxidase family enzyme
VASYQDSELFTVAEKLALELADAMTATPPDVTDELFARLREFYDEAQLVELAAIVVQENLRSRLNTTFRIESVGMYCPLPTGGPAQT